MRRIFFGAAIAAAAVALTYLFDPDRGRSRRARLADQAAARGRDLATAARGKAKYKSGVIKGVTHDLVEPFRPERTYDDETLLQKIRSEALGRFDESGDIEIDIREGRVTLTGSVATEDDRSRLTRLIEQVDGVTDVEDTMHVRATTAMEQ